MDTMQEGRQLMVMVLMFVLTPEIILGQQLACQDLAGSAQSCCSCGGALLLCPTSCPAGHFESSAGNTTDCFQAPNTTEAPPSNTTSSLHDQNSTAANTTTTTTPTLTTTTTTTTTTLDIQTSAPSLSNSTLLPPPTNTSSPSPPPTTSSAPWQLVGCRPCHVTCRACVGARAEDCTRCPDGHELVEEEDGAAGGKGTPRSRGRCALTDNDSLDPRVIAVVVVVVVMIVVLVVVMVVKCRGGCRRCYRGGGERMSGVILTISYGGDDGGGVAVAEKGGKSYPLAAMASAKGEPKQTHSSAPSKPSSSYTPATVQTPPLLMSPEDAYMQLKVKQEPVPSAKLTPAATKSSSLTPPQEGYEPVEVSSGASSKPTPKATPPEQVYEPIERSDSFMKEKTTGPSLKLIPKAKNSPKPTPPEQAYEPVEPSDSFKKRKTMEPSLKLIPKAKSSPKPTPPEQAYEPVEPSDSFKKRKKTGAKAEVVEIPEDSYMVLEEPENNYEPYEFLQKDARASAENMKPQSELGQEEGKGGGEKPEVASANVDFKKDEHQKEEQSACDEKKEQEGAYGNQEVADHLTLEDPEEPQGVYGNVEAECHPTLEGLAEPEGVYGNVEAKGHPTLEGLAEPEGVYGNVEAKGHPTLEGLAEPEGVYGNVEAKGHPTLEDQAEPEGVYGNV